MGNNKSLSGKTILVTGAANRIGKAIALAAAEQGANIALHYNQSKKQAIETTEQIAKLGTKVAAFSADISNYEEVEKMRNDINCQLGTVFGIVNNAGYVQMKSLFQYKPNEWKKEIDVCLNGVINLAYHFLPQMRELGEGKFVTIVGDSARIGDRKLIISASARSGVISFMKSIAKEVGRQQIQCNTVAIGLINQNDLHMSEEDYKRLIHQYPLNRLGKAEDISGMIQFLLSNQSNWITGQVFAVNGGFSMIG